MITTNRGLPAEIAGSQDVAGVVALVNGAYRGEGSRRGWPTEADLLGGQRADAGGVAALLAGPGRVLLVLRDAGEIVACVHLERLAQGVCYLGMLTVRPDAQSGGLGRRMLEAAECHARQHFGSSIMEMTVIEARSELIAWYGRRGYRATGEYRPFPYGDARFGVPLRDDLRFVVLRRDIGPDGGRPCAPGGSVQSFSP